MYFYYYIWVVIFKVKLVAVYGILGGEDVYISDAPYQVSYADKCGAVLIHKKWAMTTAHCGPEGTYIRIGSRHRLKGPKAQIVSHLVHPKYQKHHDFDYDIQLLKLFKGLHFGPLVRAVKICNDDCGGQIRVFGWGDLVEKGNYNDLLQGVDVELVPIKECQKVKHAWFDHTLTSRMFCAGGLGKDACQGDSGGAAVYSNCKDHLVGLSSFGYGCGRDLPGVYTNVSHQEIREWITAKTGV